MSDRKATGAGSSPRATCHWAHSGVLARYHDLEWGVPVHEDRLLFELLILEGAQAGLSWETVLKKRERYREVFEGFDANRIALYGAAKVRALMRDAGIIRNRLKISSTISNARAFLEVQKQHRSFDAFIWQFTGGKTLRPKRRTPEDIPAQSPESDAMSKALKKLGFRFVGSTICYSFMQATGMVNDHLQTCFRHKEIG
jgi:DNA-3-methyladenine glycosylase I